MKPRLLVTSGRFSPRELERWKNGTYSLLKNFPHALEQILRKKACARPGRRFFGEAHVLADERYDDAWYGSFKWLTSARWCSDQRLGDEYRAKFRDALLRHFPNLSEFQRVASAATAVIGGPKPVSPDLWLTTRKRHRFIEVKLPGDRIARHQLFGLALIAMFLDSDRPVSVELVNLSADDVRQPSYDAVDEFESICKRLRGLELSNAAAAQHRDGAGGAGTAADAPRLIANVGRTGRLGREFSENLRGLV